ncbi:MAG: hypothetical protein M0Z48_00540 [Nitrospiraceae bacterium]|nr:hypothetical protein [Nitrospiraceae bacterium]
MADAKKERYRRIRGLILKLLVYVHPKTMDPLTLMKLLDDLDYRITEDELDSYIDYLEEKKLVEVIERKGNGVRLKMVKISPRGIDVLDGESETGIDVCGL